MQHSDLVNINESNFVFTFKQTYFPQTMNIRMFSSFLCALSLFGCQSYDTSKNEEQIKPIRDTIYKNSVVKKLPIENIKNQDVIQVFHKDDTIRFSKKRLELATKLIPTFNMAIVESPDVAYIDRPKPLDVNNDEEKDFLSFGCEVCKDDYFLMYAHFLKNKNRGEEAECRERLINIFRLINELHRTLNQGGTYFSHQHYRIYAYAEYAVYLKIYYGEDYEKKYPVTLQKSFFINSLKQLILDDEKHNKEVLQSEKKRRKSKMLENLTDLNKLISDHFYLEQSQKFNYKQY
ncbi:MAG: hypothetical protein REI64_12735 [Pedobacter sp.]|uniref:hypothetical protein n=1 Tax=Pedobacter sp. TaxID=1411316 RepID=UPI002809B0CA|nr:hypothetical protein [Pedobacter sp.]MDQ8005662.1 hypothetical protein [Pedobacter sp.]